MSARIVSPTYARMYALSAAKVTRPGWKCERVSKSFIDRAEAHLKAWIRDQVQSHPSKGVTLR